MTDSGGYSVVALVPMRHSSERVPGKNYRSFGGRPLYHHILDTLRATPQIDRVVVDTDSPIVRDGIEALFPDVIILDRPDHLCAGEVPMTDVLRHDVDQVEATWYVQTHTTNPLLSSSTISEALKVLLEGEGAHDSLFSVTRLQARLWWDAGRPINHDPNYLMRTQDLAPIYLENSNLYMFRRETIINTGKRIGNTPLLFEISGLEAWDIDEEVDFRIAEMFFNEGVS